MNLLSSISDTISDDELLNKLVELFLPYAKELLHSGGDFSYMNMYADNFKEELQQTTQKSEETIYELLNKACDISWTKASQL